MRLKERVIYMYLGQNCFLLYYRNERYTFLNIFVIYIFRIAERGCGVNKSVSSINRSILSGMSSQCKEEKTAYSLVKVQWPEVVFLTIPFKPRCLVRIRNTNLTILFPDLQKKSKLRIFLIC
jgi:hypothetical protein